MFDYDVVANTVKKTHSSHPYEWGGLEIQYLYRDICTFKCRNPRETSFSEFREVRLSKSMITLAGRCSTRASWPVGALYLSPRRYIQGF